MTVTGYQKKKQIRSSKLIAQTGTTKLTNAKSQKARKELDRYHMSRFGGNCVIWEEMQH